MRVLYVCADAGIPLDGTKGASIHVRQTIESLAAEGVQVTVLAARPGASATLPARILKTESPGASRPVRAVHAAGSALSREMEGLAFAWDLASTAPVSRGMVDLVYERYSLWSLAGLLLAERLGAPLALEVNAPLVEEQARYRGLTLEGTASEIERVLARRADAILCVSSALLERMMRLRGRPEGVHLLPNAVDVDLFRPRGPRDTEEITVVFSGSLKPWHGLAVLLEAFARLLGEQSKARLLIIGHGPERERLHQLASDLGIRERVTFTGAVAHERVPELLTSADIGVSPASADAGAYFSPMKAGEYLAAGLAVVAADHGDLPALLRRGNAAVLVPPGSVGALADALITLAADSERRRILGLAARDLAVRHLSLKGAASHLVGLMEEMMAKRSSIERVQAS